MTLQQTLEIKKNAIPKPHVLRKEYAEFLAGYKTVSSKKTAMTKEIKEQIWFVNSLQESYERHKTGAWYDGVFYFLPEIRRAAYNLNLMFQIKAEIK